MPEYFWWNGTDLARFVAELAAKGLDNVRVEFRPNAKEPGKSMLYVVDKGSRALESHETNNDGHNFAHPCPPDCP